MFKFMNNKKGFIAPFTFFVLTVMTIYLGVFVKSTIDGYFISKRNLYNLQGKYQALRGIEYASSELSLQGEDWHTHTAVKEGNDYVLVPLTQQEQTPNVVLTDTCEIDADGYYSAKDGQFSVMCYISPDSGQHIIYAKSGDSNIYASKIVFRDLFQYFMFTPNELFLSYITADSSNTTLGGGIHSNQDIVFGDRAHLLNTAELSTPETIRYFVETYLPEGYVVPGYESLGLTFEQYYYWLRFPWVKPYQDAFGTRFYRNTNDGHISGENTGLLMEDPYRPGRYIDWDPSHALGQPYIDPDSNPALYQNGELISKINDNILPNRLSETYLWNKFWRLKKDFGSKVPISGDIFVTYTNSKQQPTKWSNLMRSGGLDNIVKEANSGGKEIDPFTVDDKYYKSEAQKNGIYIRDSDLGTSVKVGAEIMLTDAEGKVMINGDVVFEVKDFRNTNSTYTNKSLVIYVDKMIKNELAPANGIIFSENMGVVLDNAERLPSAGLTTISRKNIYIKGDYNSADWQPSAAISAGFTYLLSDQFNYPALVLPYTFHDREYPYEADFSAGQKNYYAAKYTGMANSVDRDYTYIVSIVSHNLTPETLERWWYYQNPGDLNNPPSYDNIIEHKRHLIGSIIQLPQDNFPILGGQYDLNQKGLRYRENKGWPEDMGSVTPKGEYNYFSYDEHYLEANSPKPPGSSVPINKLTIKLNPTYWGEQGKPATHCGALN